MPLAEMIFGLQKELEKVISEIQTSLHLCAKPMWLEERSSGVNFNVVSNAAGNRVQYDGTPPQIVAFNPVADQYFRHLDWIYERAFEIAGMSQLSVQSKKPPGLNAGVALETYHDIESERHFKSGKAWESMFMDLAKLMIRMARVIYERDGKFEVRLESDGAVDTIDWGDIDLNEDAYIMKVYPTGLFPSTPSGKLQQVDNLIKLGALTDKDEILSLLDFPDTQHLFKYANAEKEIIEQDIETMLNPDGPEPVSPEPFVRPQRAIIVAKAAYLRAVKEDASDLSLDYLSRYIEECKILIDEAQAAMAPPPAPGAPMPDAAPEPMM